jgi:hypothetical protein
VGSALKGRNTLYSNAGAVKGMDYGPKQLWEFEDEFVVGVWVLIFSLYSTSWVSICGDYGHFIFWSWDWVCKYTFNTLFVDNNIEIQ